MTKLTFKNLRTNHRMQVRLHVIKYKVDVLVILGLDDVKEPDDVVVSVKLLQEHDLSEGTLRIRSVMEGIEDLLQSDDLLVLLVDGLPNDAISSLTQLLDDLELPENMWF